MFKNVIAEIDRQIAQLQQAKAILGGSTGTTKRRGRPAGSKNKATTKGKSRKLSAAGRKAIAEAQRKRWAALKTKKRS
jgi:hypothetical protein